MRNDGFASCNQRATIIVNSGRTCKGRDRNPPFASTLRTFIPGPACVLHIACPGTHFYNSRGRCKRVLTGPHKTMRNTLRTAILAALFLAAAGCSKYDRELMGEPEPKEPANPTYTAEPQPANDAAYADSDAMDIGMFHDLDGYGQWFERDPYGWVWRPTATIGWQPFTQGHWIWTSYGWMWVDYDPWGWATSHYGYWYDDFTLGWVWVPDYTWSPVQCDWMQYGDYIGWSPVSPPGASFKEPWDGSKAWVWVPTRKFKSNDVADFRETPKFKSGDDANIQRGAPALTEIQRKAGTFPLTEVTLDRRTIRDREFARVKYPPDQQEIIAERRTVPIKSSPGGFSAPSSSMSGGSDWNPPTTSTVGPTQPSQPTQTKSKGTSSKPADSKTTTKYKSQSSKKEPSKSKDDSGTTKKGKG